MKNIGAYMVLSVPLGFLLGLGEYLTIQTDVPDSGPYFRKLA